MRNIKFPKYRKVDPNYMTQFNTLLFGSSTEAWQTYQDAINMTQDIVRKHYLSLNKPYSGIADEKLKGFFDQATVCPEESKELADVLQWVGEKVLQHSVVVQHPAYSAHLHCPPLTASLVAEMLISLTNQSMDSWDQSPSATLLEEKVVKWLVQMLYGSVQGDGVFTSGGTQSNLMGLLLARDQYIKEHFQWDVKYRGLPSEASRMRIICSEEAHFTVQQSAAILGLGEKAVIPVPVDKQKRLSLLHLDETLAHLHHEKLYPFALFATAGTTNYGSIDPLRELAQRAKKHQLWFHVDAAYGGGVVLSDLYQQKLNGIEKADSITIDFHKMFYQPISCGTFLIREAKNFELMRLHAEYLNPEADEEEGLPNLVRKSVQTTRRFDALKLFISLQTVGRLQFSQMIDHTIEMAQLTAKLLIDDPQLEIMNPEPALNTVVFRYILQDWDEQDIADEVNKEIRERLLRNGSAVIGQTKIQGVQCMKLTLLNPTITIKDVQMILQQVKQVGFQIEQERGVEKNV